MCSNKNNNRTHALPYYVVEVDGVMVDRRTVTDPVRRVEGMPARIIPAEQPTVAATAPLAGAAEPADAVASPLAHISLPDATLAGVAHPANAATNALAQIPLADRPRLRLPIPVFNAGPTIEANRAAHRQQGLRHRAAIKADRAVRKAHHKQVRKLRSYKAAKENAAALPQLPQVARSNADGLTAARQLTAQQAPAQIFSQESLVNKCRQYGHNPLAHALVKANIWRNSTMMASVDLRDDKERSYDGNTIRRGAIYEPETALNCTKVTLQIWAEMTSNHARALNEFRRVAEYCPELRSLRVENFGERNRQAARNIAQVLRADLESGESGFGDQVTVDFVASGYYP